MADSISNVNQSYFYMRELTYRYIESNHAILLLKQSTPKQLENIKQIAIQITVLGATNYFNPTPGIPQEHDSTPRRLSSVYPRQATHVLFTKKNGPVESECKRNNVNPHIIRNQYQIQNQRKVTLNEHTSCK